MTKRELAKAIKVAQREYNDSWAAVYNADEENSLHQTAMDAILKCMKDLERWRKRRDSVTPTSKKAVCGTATKEQGGRGAARQAKGAGECMNPKCNHCGKEIRPTMGMRCDEPAWWGAPMPKYHDKCWRKRRKKQCDELVRRLRRE